MKRIISLILTVFTFFSSFSLISCSFLDFSIDFPLFHSIKNVILVIGDGMGENHILNTLTYFDLENPNFFQGRHGSLATHSADNIITDSAAGATAFSTGVKVNNGEVAQHDGVDLESISELALKAGKRVGIVTTDTLSGATPAAFSSHAGARTDTLTIARRQAESGIHLLIGEKVGTTYDSVEADFVENDYAFARTPEEMLAYADSDKLIATLPNVRSSYSAGKEEHYQLIDMVKFAMEFLENKNGYFLMIEGAYIDKFSHAKQITPALCEVRSLFDCAEYLYENVDKQTALIITADHETGKLQRANAKEDIASTLYRSYDHSSADVPVFLKNCTYEYSATPQNTSIFHLCKELLHLE